MKVYIAGKISGNLNYKEDFRKVEDRESLRGNIVMTPSILPGGFKQGDYMRICFAMIDSCEAIVLLPNWIESDGAKLEKAYAEKTGKMILY